MKNKKLYDVTYMGSWLTGRAIVLAASESEAIEALRVHKNTVNFNNVEIKRIIIIDNVPNVIYNDNGEY